MASITCSNCQTESAEGTAVCPGCGAALAAAPAAPAAAPPAAPAAAPAAASQIKFDASTLAQADRITGIATIVLFISLFLPWYKVSFGGFSASGNAFSDSHAYIYLVLLISLAIIALFALRALGIWTVPDSVSIGEEKLLLIGTVVNLVLVILALLFKDSGVGWDFGAFVGLAAAIVAVVPLARPALASRKK